jgi:hypothetical protein
MTSRSALSFAAALLVAALSSDAWAHAWVFNGQQVQGQTPTISELIAGYTEVYEVRATVGKTVTLSVNDTQGCKAKILMLDSTGTSAAVTPQGTDALTFNRAFTVKANAAGTTVATITVQGEDLVNMTMGPCLENTKNLFRVIVTDDPARAELDYLKAWKPIGLTLSSSFKLNIGTAATEIRTTLGGLKKGSIDIETAAMDIYASGHKALVLDQDAIGTALGTYRGLGVTRLSQGGFPSDCEPRGFGAGSGGGWDLGLRTSYLSGFGGLQAIDKTMLSARSAIEHETAIGHQNAHMAYQPGSLQIPTYTPPSQNPEPGSKSRNDLQIQLFGGISFQNGMSVEACFWAGGRYDSAVGVPNVTVTPSVGSPITKPATIGLTDTWSARFDHLNPGLTYRMDVEYPTHTRKESCVLSMPWLEAKPGFVPFKE